ncbi:glycosyltransferase [Caldimonas sp.]|uniref:glycosyltransferase n=1 Tax=Caldimonas sp. TaxID=2838790 RepID=UPI00307F6153
MENLEKLSLRFVNELIRAGKLIDARELVERLRLANPELVHLYESKLEEIRKAASRVGQVQPSAPSASKRNLVPVSGVNISFQRLVIVTATCAANEAKRRAIDATWGGLLRARGVRHYFIQGVPELDKACRLGNTIYVPARDDYESLLLKLALAYEHLLETESNFSHVFKIDDDCYINVPVLESVLHRTPESWDYIAGAIQSKSERINRRWHFGKCRDPRFDKEYPSDHPPATYAKGGYGYLLSRRAMSAIVRRIPMFRQELEEYVYSYEDMRVGQILAEGQFQISQLQGYHIAPPTASSSRGVAVVYDIGDIRLFYRLHQELTAELLCGTDPRAHVSSAFIERDSAYDSLGFDNIYLVNLRSAVRRRATVQWVLNREGIRYELFNAFDGQSVLGQSIFERICARAVGELKRHPEHAALEMRRGRKFIDSIGAVGYILTYIRILLDARQRGFKKFLILEDDILLRRNFRGHLARLLARIGSDYKVLMLGASQYGWDSVDISAAEAQGYYRPVPIHTCGSFACALDISVVDELLDELLSFDAPFDHIPMGCLYQRYPLDCYVAYPNIVIPDVSHSYIRDARDQLVHSEKMRWRLQDFDYPMGRVRFGVVLKGSARLRLLPPEEFNFDLFCYRATCDGLRPVHPVGNSIPAAAEEQLDAESEDKLLNGPHALPVDAAFATDRDCDGSELILEALGAAARFGSQDGRSREWLRPLQNSSRRSKQGFVSVVIPTKGRTEALVQAVHSVLEQDYQNKEIFVIDENFPQSEIARFVDDFVSRLGKSGEPVRLLRHLRQRNAAAARNTGLFASNSEFVSFLDDDDIYLPGRLSRVIDVLMHSDPSVGGAYCGYIGWNSKANDSRRYPVDQIPHRLLTLDFKSHYICTDTVTYRREALLSVNGYDESFRRHQDLELNVRVFSKWKIAVAPEALVQLNPLPPDNSNKLFDVELFEVKRRFFDKFEKTIEVLGLTKDEVLAAHVREMVNFTKNQENVVSHALRNPSAFSSAYLKEVLLRS